MIDETTLKRITYLQSQIACAMIESEGMKAENEIRKSQGLSLAYNEKAFQNVLLRHEIYHNAVIEYLYH
jgi:hypothetical protein